MTLSSVNPSPASTWSSVIQQIEEEANESVAETNEEASSGDPAAQRLVEYRADQQVPPPAPYQQPVIPGSILNIKV